MASTSEPKRVLVVDDDPSFGTFVCAALERLAVIADVAQTGGSAIRHLEAAGYSGVLLDLRLPDISGLEVLRDIHRRESRVPVVILTGAGTVPATVEAMRLGAADVLEKPISSASLAELVQGLFILDGPSDSWASGLPRLIDQIAKGMDAVIQSPGDVPTVHAWCVLIGRSESSWYAVCEMAEVSAKACLDLARLLRARRSAKVAGFEKSIDVADPRTTARLLKRAGSMASLASASSVADLLDQQQLVSNSRLTQRVAFYMQKRC